MHPTVYYSAQNKCKGKHRRVIFKPSLSISVKCKNARVKSSCCQRCAVYELMYKVIYCHHSKHVAPLHLNSQQMYVFECEFATSPTLLCFSAAKDRL